MTGARTQPAIQSGAPSSKGDATSRTDRVEATLTKTRGPKMAARAIAAMAMAVVPDAATARREAGGGRAAYRRWLKPALREMKHAEQGWMEFRCGTS
jgi:hypothetical protein